jgi:3-hydroxyacyl-CoA dehydrogenase/3-hydroxy-2-methylbutyryl-CoA dehydrogenase
MRQADCVAVVTGGASGLGEACVLHLLNSGSKAAIFDMDKVRGEKLAMVHGSEAIFCNTDVTIEESVQVAISKTLQAFNKIKVVINCAGVGNPGKAMTKSGPLPLASFNHVIQINLVGTFNVIRLCLEQMLKNILLSHVPPK